MGRCHKGKWVRIQMEANMEYFMVLPWNSPGEAGKQQKKSQDRR
jgi:hypothetical protein